MRVRTSVAIAAGAAIVSIGSLVVAGAPSWIAGASTPSFPVVCKVVGTVGFSPALTKTGTHTTNPAAVTTVTISSGRFNGCLSAAPTGAPGHGTVSTITMRIPATSLGRIGGVRTYATGYCPSFMTSSTTVKALRGVQFQVTWAGGVAGTSLFTTKKAATATNTPSHEVGFTFSGNEVTGLFAERPLNQITAYFDATDSAALSSGCSANQSVSSATFDGSNGVAIL